MMYVLILAVLILTFIAIRQTSKLNTLRKDVVALAQWAESIHVPR